MGKIELKDMEFFAHHGHYKEEQKLGNKFLVDVIIDTDTETAGKSDDIKDTIDYQEVYTIIRQHMEKPSHLLEHVVERILDEICNTYRSINEISVTISKLNPPLGGKVDRFSVTSTR